VGQPTIGRAGSAADDRDRRGLSSRSHAGPLGATVDQRDSQLVSEVNGTKSGARQAAMVKSIEATVYIDRIRELAGGTTTNRPGRGRWLKPRLGMALGSLGAAAGGPDHLGFPAVGLSRSPTSSSRRFEPTASPRPPSGWPQARCGPTAAWSSPA
jgi:hypothetical protein